LHDDVDYYFDEINESISNIQTSAVKDINIKANDDSD